MCCCATTSDSFPIVIQSTGNIKKLVVPRRIRYIRQKLIALGCDSVLLDHSVLFFIVPASGDVAQQVVVFYDVFLPFVFSPLLCSILFVFAILKASIHKYATPLFFLTFRLIMHTQ